MQELKCPHCGRVNDTHEDVLTRGEPSPGDVGICWKCRGLVMLTPFGFLRGANSPEEQARWEADRHVRRSKAAMIEAYTPSQAIKLMRGES